MEKFNVLEDLRISNPIRCITAFGKAVHEWSPTDWACAVGGETGELLNKIKKLRRGDTIPLIEVADEAADIVIYLDLLCHRMGIDLAEAIRRKFNQVSTEKGVDIFI